MSDKKKSFLGKKRVPEKELEFKASESESEESEESESNESQPKKSLFGPNETGFKGGLLGDLSKPSEKPASLFGNIEGKPSLFGNTGSSLFGNTGSSLFGNTGSSLFGNTGSSLFGNTNQSSGLFGNPSSGSLFGNNNNSSKLFPNTNTGLFNFNPVNKKEEEEDNEEEGDDNIGKSTSPVKIYNPEKEIDLKEDGDNKNKFKKIFVKKLDDFYSFNKKDNKFFTIGEGFLSIETKDEDGKKYALILYRNNFGNVIHEGILNQNINKFRSYEKKFKHIAHIYYLVNNEDKTVLSQAKIPFIKEEDLKKFEEKYNEAIGFLGKIEDKKVDKKNDKDESGDKKEEKKEDIKEDKKEDKKTGSPNKRKNSSPRKKQNK